MWFSQSIFILRFWASPDSAFWLDWNSVCPGIQNFSFQAKKGHFSKYGSGMIDGIQVLMLCCYISYAEFFLEKLPSVGLYILIRNGLWEFRNQNEKFYSTLDRDCPFSWTGPKNWPKLPVSTFYRFRNLVLFLFHL